MNNYKVKAPYLKNLDSGVVRKRLVTVEFFKKDEYYTNSEKYATVTPRGLELEINIINGITKVKIINASGDELKAFKVKSGLNKLLVKTRWTQ